LLRHLFSGKAPAVTAVRLHEGSRGAGAVDRWRQRQVCEVWNSALEGMQINKHTRGIHLVDHAASESLDPGRVVGNPSFTRLGKSCPSSVQNSKPTSQGSECNRWFRKLPRTRLPAWLLVEDYFRFAGRPPGGNVQRLHRVNAASPRLTSSVRQANLSAR